MTSYRRKCPKHFGFTLKVIEADGDEIPQWLADGDYELVYHLDTAALIRSCERYASLAAISRASGVNERQLSHYANGLKKARAQQRERIINGLHKIGRELLSLS